MQMLIVLPEVNREPIPEDVKREVWGRDNGHCVNCDSQEKIEFDSVTKRILDKMAAYNNMSLLPIIAELTAK